MKTRGAGRVWGREERAPPTRYVSNKVRIYVAYRIKKKVLRTGYVRKEAKNLARIGPMTILKAPAIACV